MDDKIKGENKIMKHILVGATGIISGIMLFGMTWIAAAIYTTRGGQYGHLAQNILSDDAGMNWAKSQWTHPLIWLYREGIATHLSRQIADNIHPSVYSFF